MEERVVGRLKGGVNFGAALLLPPSMQRRTRLAGPLDGGVYQLAHPPPTFPMRSLPTP